MAPSMSLDEQASPQARDTRDEDEIEDEPAKTEKKGRNQLFVRTVSTVVLLAVFLGVMWGGHIPCTLILILFQVMMCKEIFALARNIDEDIEIPLFRTQQWYFFFVASFYIYGRFIRDHLALGGLSGKAARIVLWVLRRHVMISYMLYTIGFVMFVLTLKKGQYKYQFKQFAWTHLIVFFTAVPTSFFVPLIFEGLMWFLMPCAFIIINDIMAYLAGITMGRTPLIALSPKKTWEGFLGGALGTMVAAIALAWLFAQSKWLRCPRRDLSWGPLHCEATPMFTPTEYQLSDMWSVLPELVVDELKPMVGLLPAVLREAAASVSWSCMPVQMHAIVLAAFASIIGPFGGFFASGFKRAFKLKDFGDSIPGHGGVTDRFDCQMMMAVFAYLYYQTYINRFPLEDDVISSVMDWSLHLQVRVFERLLHVFANEAVLPDELLIPLHQALADYLASAT